MAYRKDEGRYARMIAFWALTLLFAYGCLGGLRIKLGQWIGTSDTVIVEQFPLLGTLKVSTMVAIGVLLVVVFIVWRFVNRPRIADSLVDTETEMRKVTWPTLSDTWAGTIAVVVVVLVLLAFLSAADYALVSIVKAAIVGGGL